MAAAWFNRLADFSKARAVSAGTDPGPHVHPEVIATMREVGIEYTNAETTRLTPELADQAQLLVMLGCGEQCPYVPGAIRDDWPIEDPKGKHSREFGKPVTKSGTVSRPDRTRRMATDRR
jgi:arsenate reductase